MVLREMSLLGSASLTISLESDLSYSLDYDGRIVYRNGTKTVNGKTSPYVFRSVEQLRYDFERDVAAVGGRLA
jgi:hypothetical protein